MSREDHEDLKSPPRMTTYPAPDGGPGSITMVDSASDERTVNNTMRHQYRVLSPEEKEHMLEIKDLGLAFLDAISRVEEDTNGKREFALARTKVEEAVMWAVKGITG